MRYKYSVCHQKQSVIYQVTIFNSQYMAVAAMLLLSQAVDVYCREQDFSFLRMERKQKGVCLEKFSFLWFNANNFRTFIPTKHLPHPSVWVLKLMYLTSEIQGIRSGHMEGEGENQTWHWALEDNPISTVYRSSVATKAWILFILS